MPLIRKPVEPVRAPPPAATDVLQLLTSGTQEERWSAARAAVAVPNATEPLAAALRTEADPRVREAMFTSLARIGSRESVNAIARHLRSDDASLRTGALDALRTLHDVVREQLPALMNDADSDVRVLSCEVARGFPSPEATRMLCDLLKRETEPNVCAAAIDVLAEVGDAMALPVLAECATRLRDTPFLAFAIKIATARILEQSTDRHG
jgi:HEAT repeat protein